MTPPLSYPSTGTLTKPTTPSSSSSSSSSSAFVRIARKGPLSNSEQTLWKDNNSPSSKDVLSALLSATYPLPNTTLPMVDDLIRAGSLEFRLDHDVNNAVQFCQWLYYLHTKQPINPAELTPETIDGCIQTILMAYSNSSSTQAIDILRTLSLFLLDTGAMCSKLHDQLLKTLTPPAQSSNENFEVRRMAINCLGNLCSKTGPKFHSLHVQVLDVLIPNLDYFGPGSVGADGDVPHKMALAKNLNSALRAVALIINENKNAIMNHVSILISYLQRHIFSSISYFTSENHVSEQRPRSKNKPPMNRSWSLSSDSEMSDSGSSYSQQNSMMSASRATALKNQINMGCRLQYNALYCLQVLAKNHSRMMTGYWNRFLSDIPDPSVPSLLGFLKSPRSAQGMSGSNLSSASMVKIRTAVCGALLAMLDGSKQYLGIAIESDSKYSYTSLSEKLGYLVGELHNELIKYINTEPSPTLKSQFIRCLAVLVKNTTYERLKRNYRKELVQSIVKYLSTSEDTSLVVAVLDCLSAVFDTEMNSEEMATLIFTNQDIGNKQSLYDYLLGKAGDGATHYTICVASCELLCCVVRRHFATVKPSWEKIDQVLSKNIGNKEVSIRVVSFKLLEEYLHTLCSDNNQDSSQPIDFFIQVIDKFITKALLDESDSVRSLGCDSLASIAPKAMDNLPPNRRVHCLTSTLHLANDPQPTVRASACRTLGIYMSIPSIREDFIFINDVSNAVVVASVNDTNLNVRIRSSWAVANLADALVAISEQDTESGLSQFAEAFFVELIRAGLSAAKDNEKCRANGVRALGSLLRIAPPNFLAVEKEALIKEAFQIILKSVDSGPVKSRWNACHALANILTNQAFPIESCSYAGLVWSCLINTVKKSKNYKVRIHAASALATPKTWQKYGSKLSDLVTVMEAVLEAFATADEMDENVGFGEFKYKEQLREQLHQTFEHLKSLVPTQQSSETEKVEKLCKEMEKLFVGVAKDSVTE